MDSNTTLYITKRNDSLESIAKEHNIEVSEILRLNPLAKYRIFEGQPLILKINKEEQKELRNEEKDPKIDTALLAYKIKELIITASYFDEYFKLLKDNFLKFVTSFTINETIILIIEKLTLFPIYIKEKRDTQLMNIQKEIKTKINEYKDTNDNYSINKFVEYVELFSLKFLSGDFKDAELYFEMYKKELNYLIINNI